MLPAQKLRPVNANEYRVRVKTEVYLPWIETILIEGFNIGMTGAAMYKTLSTFLKVAIITLPALQALSVKADNGPQPRAPVESGINTLPPVGKGLDMVKPYHTQAPEPAQVRPGLRGDESRARVQAPLSRELVPPSYRYGSPGYMPDGRGGRGYDFGYPGYRDQGGGGYPHNRGW